ncbi:hypothetical protein EPO17_01575 [Patescibacteria group bacterium]|nr:MAG: hypothetical protein EPO17_01575 [Patescibacteria group bacterium]
MPKKPTRSKGTSASVAVPAPTNGDQNDARDDLRSFGPGVRRKPPAPTNQSNIFMRSLVEILAPGLTIDETHTFLPDEPLDPNKHRFIGVIIDPGTKALMSLAMELHEKARQLPLPRNKAAQAGYSEKMSILKRQEEIAILLADEAIYAAFPELEDGKTDYSVCEGWIVVVEKPTTKPDEGKACSSEKQMGSLIVTAFHVIQREEAEGPRVG